MQVKQPTAREQLDALNAELWADYAKPNTDGVPTAFALPITEVVQRLVSILDALEREHAACEMEARDGGSERPG